MIKNRIYPEMFENYDIASVMKMVSKTQGGTL